MKALIVLTWLLFLPVEINAQGGDYVETNGVKIYYETHGEGEPLLMLHGFGASHKSWNLWIEDLSKNHQLILPDLRGHGLSSIYTQTVCNGYVWPDGSSGRRSFSGHWA